MDETTSWLESLSTALVVVHSTFNNNPKTILTESDLKCWLFHELQTIKNIQYRSIKNRSEFDCKTRKMRILAYALYPEPMGQGHALFNKGEALDWQAIKPKTLNDLYLKRVCNKKK